jgi:predicted membrane protein
MANTNTGWDKVFFGFFILTVISGIYLISQEKYLAGISGSITGLFLIYLQKMNKTKEKNNE